MGVGVQGRGRRLSAAADDARDAAAPRDLRTAVGYPSGSSQPRVLWLLIPSDQSDWLRETGALSKLFGTGGTS